MHTADGEIAEIMPDFIVLDEFHSAGARIWGENVGSFLSVYSDVLSDGQIKKLVSFYRNDPD